MKEEEGQIIVMWKERNGLCRINGRRNKTNTKEKTKTKGNMENKTENSTR